MRSASIITLAALVGISMVSAASPHGKFDRRSHKALIAERQAKEAAAVNEVSDIKKRASRKYKKRGGKVCRVKDAASASTLAGASSSGSSTASSTASVAINTPTVAAAILQPASTTASAPAVSSSSSQAWGDWQGSSPSSSAAWTSETWPTTTSSTSSSHAPEATTAPPANSGLLYASGPCGDSSSSADHPNGALWWLNCGLSDAGGWNPPSVKASDLIAINDPSTHPEIFGSCLQYQDIFSDAAAKNNMPTALLMSIGMQESGCNRDATGARGEQGIMQVAGNACDAGDCKEPWYNIHKGASILVGKMGGDPNGNIISALGQYNGWMPGMHAGSGAEYGPEGQKVSYLDDMLNKWLQGKRSW